MAATEARIGYGSKILMASPAIPAIYTELGEVTFWVEYREERGVFTVLKAWSHRMRIAGGRI